MSSSSAAALSQSPSLDYRGVTQKKAVEHPGWSTDLELACLGLNSSFSTISCQELSWAGRTQVEQPGVSGIEVVD